MKKVYSNRVIIYFSIFGIVFFSIAAIICVFLLINSILNNQPNMIIVSSVLLVGFICFVALLGLMLNRFGYKIIYNAARDLEEYFFISMKLSVKVVYDCGGCASKAVTYAVDPSLGEKYLLLTKFSPQVAHLFKESLYPIASKILIKNLIVY